MNSPAAKLYRTVDGPLVEAGGNFHPLAIGDWDALINRDDLFEYLQACMKQVPASGRYEPPPAEQLLPPIGTQEVWAAGVNYTSGRAAQGKEVTLDGAAEFYRRAYHADRPQLFFKAPHYRVSGPGGTIRIRRDSLWSFPEPELTLFVTSGGKIVAYTVGNDVSSGSIEGENPLYLPQAKTYDGCAALGPCLLVTQEPIDPGMGICLSIRRGGKEIFSGATGVGMIKRSFPELIDYLFRETSFRPGVFLMTGSGIVPPPESTLCPGDLVTMTIDGIGALTSTVTHRS